MVDIAPIRGITFSQDEVKKNGGLLTAPPYDVLTQKQRAEHHNRCPHNILHIDLGVEKPGDATPYAWHERSREIFESWLKEGVLKKNDKPAIYQMETECLNPETGEKIIRHGFVCLVKLEEFSKNSGIRPHEKTFSSHKEERFSLMKSTKAHLSQVFGFFPDEDQEIFKLITDVKGKTPQMDFTDQSGLTHRLWINEDQVFINAVRGKMKERKIYIADGHHRYETALNYRRHILSQGIEAAPDSALNYAMFYLCPMSDPGLCILPTHRLLGNQLKFDFKELMAGLEKYFKIEKYPFDGANKEKVKADFTANLNKPRPDTATMFGLYSKDENAYYTIELKDGVRERALNLKDEPKALAVIDSFVLGNLVFMEVLKMTEADLDNPDLITYISSREDALKSVEDGDNRLAFLLRATTVEEILNVSEADLVMPRKSTYFYPKVTSGLVINQINPEDKIA